MEVLAIIPARSGSKSVKDKNIRGMNGVPMLAYSVKHALASKTITRTIISTDSEKYARIAKEYGCEVPFLRPQEYATDTALDFDVFYHALTYLKETEGYVPDIVVQLRPTYPIRDVGDIDAMVQMLAQDAAADSVRCIAPAKEIAYKMWREKDGVLTPLLQDIPEAYNMPRQQLPEIYYQNACIDVMRASTILEKKSMTGDRILGYKMTHNFDIDTEDDFIRAEQSMQMLHCSGKKFVFDIDGVIAQKNAGLQYDQSEPNQAMIDVINWLYDSGNEIVLFTARGYKTGIDWTEVTKTQMEKWGVKHHQLLFGKPDADFYIDDKMIGMNELYALMKGEK